MIPFLDPEEVAAFATGCCGSFGFLIGLYGREAHMRGVYDLAFHSIEVSLVSPPDAPTIH